MLLRQLVAPRTELPRTTARTLPGSSAGFCVYGSGALDARVCTENLNLHVMVMKPAKDRV